ncbi:MAG: hypothetical protein MI863_12170 [Desulfobacterales bacterium]|nr:hypothetical protein [Desulfobacterales bacterium]
MNKKSFINNVKSFVRDAAVEDTYENAIAPPGKTPTEIEKSIANWVNSLSSEEKDYIQHLIKAATDETLFGLLCVIDGVRTVTEEDGNFVLQFKTDTTSFLLNDSKDEYLHDIFNEK